jgi:hypothetical protein
VLVAAAGNAAKSTPLYPAPAQAIWRTTPRPVRPSVAAVTSVAAPRNPGRPSVELIGTSYSAAEVSGKWR